MHICVCVWWTCVPWCEGDTHVGSEDSFMESFLSFHLYIGSIQVSLLTFFFPTSHLTGIFILSCFLVMSLVLFVMCHHQEPGDFSTNRKACTCC